MKYTTDVFPKYGEPVGPGTRQNRQGYLQPMRDAFSFTPVPFPLVDVKLEALRNRLLAIASVVAWAAVDQSLRWAPKRNQDGKLVATYCDHYAWDVLCKLLGKYPPLAALLWWNSGHEAAALAGEDVPVVYPRNGKPGTVREYGATSLAQWLEQYAEDFGWLRFDEPDALQAYLDSHGTVGIICCERRSAGASHITVAVPSLVAKALGITPAGEGVLQTEAGAQTNVLTKREWYTAKWKRVHLLALPPEYWSEVVELPKVANDAGESNE